MSEFKRRLDRIERLKSLATSSDENWWKELLRFWRTSGTNAGTHGLRLAIRDNYLTFIAAGNLSPALPLIKTAIHMPRFT